MQTQEISTQFDVYKIREDFPILHQEVNGKPLIYLDNAATSQKPKAVIEALDTYYLKNNANIHRGAHYLAAKSTGDYEQTREAIRAFLNARWVEEIIFTRGVTEGVNLVASTWGRKNLQVGDEVILSTMEHHSNIVPWQLIVEEKGALIKVIPITDSGELILEEYCKLLSPKTKIVSIVHASNSLGTINPVKEIIDLAHEFGAVVMIDGAQASVHLDVDVQALNCDFYAFSGHKVYAPTGIGALYGKKEHLEAMPPYHGGGEMIKDVSFERTTFNEIPHKFEAGTPNIADAIAFKNALDYVAQIGKAEITTHEKMLLVYATERLLEIPGLRIIGTAPEKVSLVSFVIEGIHHGDLGTLLDLSGIAVRTGHHCTQPLMTRFGISGTTRASFAMYNTREEIDALVEGIRKAVKMLS
ncbi:MAG: cysteine desulfurase [Microscillaceae bacterium]|nr:cysteine desulfurase [Microscillaceae bacterium]